MTVTQISLRHFKCFAAADIPLLPLTLLTGFNAAGKSTTLQSLLILSQGLRNLPSSRFVALNGPYVRLGTASDVIRIGARGPIQFGVRGFGDSLTWEFAPAAKSIFKTDDAVNGDENTGTEVEGSFEDEITDRRRLELIALRNNDGENLYSGRTPHLGPPSNVARNLRNAIRSLVFLGATRQIRLDVFPSPDEAVPIYSDVGHEGQYAAWWYVQTADNRVRIARRHPQDKSVTVRAQVDAWLNYLFPGAAANAEILGETGTVSLKFKLGGKASWTRPTNIGFGLSYAFPLIVALLNVRPGRIVVVDSPEAHLHPQAQSRMGYMLASFAASGVQILVETHSDHVLSGVRLAVRQLVIPFEHLAVHFFSGKISESSNGIITPVVKPDGRLSDWPEGFFDQSDIDLAALAEP